MQISVDRLEKALKNLGLTSLQSLFESHAIDDSLIGRLTNEELQELGVSKLGDRKKLLKAFAELDLNAGKAPPVTGEIEAGVELSFLLPHSMGLSLRGCPAGSFWMGCPEDDDHPVATENRVKAQISKGFYIAQTTITSAQWEAVMGTNPNDFKGVNLPVESITWDMACSFARRLNRKLKLAPDGWEFALPTEAQWEYACRAGTDTSFGLGHRLSSSMANINGTVPYPSGARRGVFLKRTTPVASYSPNEWGLFDMHGNVWEWCSDWYAARLVGGTDPVGPNQGRYKVLRGGSWFYPAVRCRSHSRLHRDPSDRHNCMGFRVALVQI